MQFWFQVDKNPYPWVTEEEAIKIKSWEADYVTLIRQKKLQQDRINKTAAVNTAYVAGVQKWEKGIDALPKLDTAENKLADSIRARLDSKWVSHLETDDKILIDKFKKVYWQEWYTEYLNSWDKYLQKIWYMEQPQEEDKWGMSLWWAIWTVAWIWWVSAIALATGKPKLDIVQPFQKESVLAWETTNLWPIKGQKARSKILNDILWVAKNSDVPKEDIVKTFTEQFKPVKNFNELASQSKYLLKDKPWSTINQRNTLIAKYSTTHWDEYTKPLQEYRASLASDPQVTDTKLNKIDDIIKKEQEFINKNWWKLTTMQLEGRKEKLNQTLKRFLWKDLSTLSEADEVEKQALNRLRWWAMTEIGNIADWTADAEKIKALNKEYWTLVEINNLAESQANKFKWVVTPTLWTKVATKVRNVAKSVPVVNTITNWMQKYVRTPDQKTLQLLEKNMKYVGKYWKQLMKWMWLLDSTWQLWNVINAVTPIKWLPKPTKEQSLIYNSAKAGGVSEENAVKAAKEGKFTFWA